MPHFILTLEIFWKTLSSVRVKATSSPVYSNFVTWSNPLEYTCYFALYHTKTIKDRWSFQSILIQKVACQGGVGGLKTLDTRPRPQVPYNPSNGPILPTCAASGEPGGPLIVRRSALDNWSSKKGSMGRIETLNEWSRWMLRGCVEVPDALYSHEARRSLLC